jgi:hypothetical protein
VAEAGSDGALEGPDVGLGSGGESLVVSELTLPTNRLRKFS